MEILLKCMPDYKDLNFDSQTVRPFIAICNSPSIPLLIIFQWSFYLLCSGRLQSGLRSAKEHRACHSLSHKGRHSALSGALPGAPQPRRVQEVAGPHETGTGPQIRRDGTPQDIRSWHINQQYEYLYVNVFTTMTSSPIFSHLNFFCYDRK